MLYPILPAASSNRTVVSRTRDYLTSMPFSSATPAQIYICQRDALSNSVDADSQLKISNRFSDFHIMSLVMHDEEAVENVSTFEGTKIRVGDRLFRNLTMAGFILDGGAVGSSDVRHRGHDRWLKFYEKARFSQIASTPKIVAVDVHGIKFFGAFASYNITGNADEPSKLDLSTTFICSEIRLPSNVISTVDGTDFKGKISYEGLAHAGVIGPISYDPTNVMIDLVNTNTTQEIFKLYIIDDNTVETAVQLPAIPPPRASLRTRATLDSFKITPS